LANDCFWLTQEVQEPRISGVFCFCERLFLTEFELYRGEGRRSYESIILLSA